MKKNFSIVFKRLGAMIFDILGWFLLSIILLALAVDPLVNSVTSYNDKKYTYDLGLFDAYAYVYVEYKLDETSSSYKYEFKYDASCTKEERDEIETNLNSYDNNSFYLISITSVDLNTDEYMCKFYDKIGGQDALNYYKDLKANNSNLFDENGVALENADKDELKDFYTQALYNAIYSGEYFKKYEDGKYYDILKELNKYDNIKAYSSYFVSLLIFYLIIPIISKKRQTLGKMVMRLTVVDVKTNKTAKIYQMCIRFAALAIIEFFLSLLLSNFLYLPLLVSIILMIVTKNNSAIHDYVASTMVIEVPYVNPYLAQNINEENVEKDDTNEPIDVEIEEIDENDKFRRL